MQRPPSPPDDNNNPDLAPPRPFFLAAGRPRRTPSSDAAPPPPPSAFPFQAYPGNPDPLPASYGRRRVSLESLANTPAYAYIYGAEPDTPTLPRSGSLGDLHRPQPPFAEHGLTTSSSSSSLYRASAAAPIAQPPALSPAQIFRPPFLSPASRPTSTLSWSPPVLDYSNNGSSTALHLSASNSNLALAHMQHRPPLPSTMLEKNSIGKGGSVDSLDPKEVVQPVHTPKRHRPSYWVTFACILIGVAGAAVLCYTGVNDIKKKMLDESQLCLVMDEDFTSGTLNDAYWSRDVQIDERGFQITTNDDKNLFVQNNQLYIFPTLTRDDVPNYESDGQSYDVPGCTANVPAPAPAPAGNSTNDGNGNGNDGNSTTTAGTGTTTAARGGTTALTTHARRQQQQQDPTNSTNTDNNNSTDTGAGHGPATVSPGAGGNACKAITNDAVGSVINPVMSAKITTRGKVGIRYGRVEVVAKVASGDWLWPAVWMMPENNTYGPWPLSGEIDILEARGNGPSYPAQGTNFVRSQLQYGLDQTLMPISVPGSTTQPTLTKTLLGWFSLKRTSFNKSFHTYVVEWDTSFVRFWVDGRVRSILEVDVDPRTKPAKGSAVGGGGTFWDKGRFPPTAQNRTTGGVVVVRDPWEAGEPTAPFDQRFYLNIDLGVGGKTGWFPDEQGGKPWYDGSLTAMRDFNKALDTWYATWPQSADDRAFRISSVRMWSKEPCGSSSSN